METRRDDDEVRLGQNIANIRRSRGMSQADLASSLAAVGVRWHQSTVSKIEHGRGVSIGQAIALAKVLGAEVFDGTFLESGVEVETAPLRQQLAGADRALARVERALLSALDAVRS